MNKTKEYSVNNVKVDPADAEAEMWRRGSGSGVGVSASKGDPDSPNSQNSAEDDGMGEEVNEHAGLRV